MLVRCTDGSTLPTFSYPLARRQTGFLIPTVTYDNRLDFICKGFFWATSIEPGLDDLTEILQQAGMDPISSIGTFWTVDPAEMVSELSAADTIT
ncbi:MAG: hypothetical protein MRJ68_11300 [Nitrospira sp.]|nr:hypothetical protein [Nitrospira sp.]